MKRRLMLLSVSYILMSGLFSGNLLAGTTGKIAGKVTDAETGEPLIGANVIVVGTDYGAAANNNGNFFILSIPPGVYTVRATMIGFVTVEYMDIKISVDLTTSVKFELSSTVLEIGEVVTVTASRPLIQKDATATATLVTSEEIESAPIETLSEILGTKAGVTIDRAGRLHIRGGRADEITYIVDGVANMNPYDNTQGIEVSTNSIQELSIISGSFSAEYGQALSGVVNMVTKEGGRKYNGSISYQSGDLLSAYDIETQQIVKDEVKSFDLSNLREVEGSFGGPFPIIGGKASFFVSGRWYDRKGTFYGLDDVYGIKGGLAYTEGTLQTASAWRQSAVSGTPGVLLENVDEINPKVVPMNPLNKLNLQAKASFRLSSSLKLQYTMISDDRESQSYGSVTQHRRKFLPDGRLNYFEDGKTHILKLTHQLSNTSFYTFAGSRLENNYEYYAYKAENDPRYVWSGYYLRDANYEFNTGGTQNNRLSRQFKTNSFKFDYSSQLSEQHELKVGVDYKKHNFNQQTYSILADRIAEPFSDENGNGVFDVEEKFDDENNNGIWDVGEEFTDTDLDSIWDAGEAFEDQNGNEKWDPTYDDNLSGTPGDIIASTGLLASEIDPKPVEFSAYIQDKIELEDMVINVGLRYDYFQPDGKVALDWSNPDTGNVKDATAKTQISPRFSLAYPITDMGKLYFSYGHFFQFPPYRRLYQNPEFDILPGVIKSDIGNADLKPQKTISYELGFEQQLASHVAAYLKVFYKDYRNLLGQRRYILPDSREYTLFINRDYGSVKGITFTLDKRFSNFFSSSVDYTFQVAEGNQSDPTQTRRDYRLNIEQEKQVVFLDWDQTHALRINTVFSKPKNWAIGFIGRVESGYPYTPVAANELVRIAEENSGRKIPILDFDINAYKSFSLSVGDENLLWTVYAKVYNLFDRKNENYVWDGTGRATYSLGQYGGEVSPEFENRPYWFSRPRTLFLGAKFEF